MSAPNVWEFKNRWRIEGVLTAEEPFHIGIGEDAPTRSRMPEKEDDHGKVEQVRVAAVATDFEGKPYLPSTALKGILRSRLRSQLSVADLAQIDAVFGRESGDGDDGTGGKVEFLDAFLAPDVQPTYSDAGTPRVGGAPPASGAHVPYWDAKRLTGISASVAIDRRTRTAVDKRLFHEEYVPPGFGFKVVITGQNLDNDEIALILLALEGFNDLSDPIRIGAGGHDGWGRFTWRRESLKCLEASSGRQWVKFLDEGARALVEHGFGEVDPASLLPSLLAKLRPVCRKSVLELELELQFDGPFLVNDPSRAKDKSSADGQESDARDEGSPANHVPLRDHQGRVVLPSKSFRGAFRSRAEKILRTLKPGVGGDPNRPDNGCDPIDDAKKVGSLSLVAQAFGSPGWAAPLEISDFFELDRCSVCQRQEFVAIDRFTGGSAARLKFDAEFVESPTLHGRISVDLTRADPWVLGLVTLVLRDLIEGDITFGFGASKGYGGCTARVVGAHLPDPFPDGAVLDLASTNGVDLAQIRGFDPVELVGRDEVQLFIMDLIESLRKKIDA